MCLCLISFLYVDPLCSSHDALQNWPLHEVLDVLVDDVPLQIPSEIRTLVFLNLPSYQVRRRSCT
jgi:hypothetical protein